MPGPKTHDIFYKRLMELLPPDPLSREYSTLAQGHDLLIYANCWKLWRLNDNIAESLLLQEWDFPQFVAEYLLEAQKRGMLLDPLTRLFIGPGYIGHHILDSLTHPLIIHHSGDHLVEKGSGSWRHGIIETQIDCWMMKDYQGLDCRTYPLHRDFPTPRLTPELIALLDDVVERIYGISGGGRKFDQGLRHTRPFVRWGKYDPLGWKHWLCGLLEPIAPGAASFSCHIDPESGVEYLNLNHKEWPNPKDGSIVSTRSLPELFEEALELSAGIIQSLDALCRRGSITREEILAIVPDVSSNYGLVCHHK